MLIRLRYLVEIDKRLAMLYARKRGPSLFCLPFFRERPVSESFVTMKRIGR